MALDKLHAIVSDVYFDLRDWWYCIHAHRNTVGRFTVLYFHVELVRVNFNRYLEGEDELKECKKLDKQLTAAKVSVQSG